MNRDNHPDELLLITDAKSNNFEFKSNKQIEEMDTILRSIFGCPFAYKIDYGKYGGFEGHKEVYTKDIAKELTAKGYRKIYDDHQRQCTCYALGCQMAESLKRDVAREIFDEIEKQLARYSHIHRYAEEARTPTEEYADGIPCEMVSVWEVISLNKNGWDDYETMNKLQDNIENIAKSRILKEFEEDIAELKKKYTESEKENAKSINL